MTKLRLLDLFSGIGGFSLGLERTGGFETVAFCEIEPFPRKVLAKHWPKVPCYDDVRTLTAERLRADGIGVDVICGGFPCQDISKSGKRAGISGARSGLWSEIARLVGDLRPQFIIVENVAALLGNGLDRVLGDLAALGYDAEWHCIPAGSVGAPHIRDRLWLVANPNGDDDGGKPDCRGFRNSTSSCFGETKGPNRKWYRRGFGDGRQTPDVADSNQTGWANVSWGQTVSECGWLGTIGDTSRWSPEPAVGRVAHGLSHGLARWRKRAVESLGNAVVPQIPELIGRAILASLEPQAEAA